MWLYRGARARAERPYGASWQQCEAQRDFIAERLRAGLRLSKVRRLLARQGVMIPSATPYRFATAVLGFGRHAPTVPVADGAPGEEVYLDTAGRAKRERALGWSRSSSEGADCARTVPRATVSSVAASRIPPVVNARPFLALEAGATHPCAQRKVQSQRE